MVRTAAPSPAELEIQAQAALIMNRIDGLQARLETVARETETSVKRIEQHVDHLTSIHETRLSDIEQSVTHAVRDNIDLLRVPLDSSMRGFTQLDQRLGGIETRQSDLNATLDARLAEMAYQSRLAMVGGGLIVVAAIVVMLLK